MAIDSVDCTVISLIVGNREFGVLIQDIQEIIEPVPVLPVPVTHPVLEGLFPLRGTVIPLLSLRVALNQSENRFTDKDRKFVICTSGIDSVALDVDAIGESLPFVPDQLVEADSSSAQAYPHGMVTKEIHLEEKSLALLSLTDLSRFVAELNKQKRMACGYVR